MYSFFQNITFKPQKIGECIFLSKTLHSKQLFKASILQKTLHSD